MKAKNTMRRYKPFLKYIIPIIIGITFATIAYANTTYDLEVDGTLSLGMQEGVIITDARMAQGQTSANCTYKADHYVGTFLKNTLNLNAAQSRVTATIEVKNTDNVKYRFDGVLYDDSSNPELGAYSNPDIVPQVLGGDFEVGDILDPQDSEYLQIEYTYVGSDFSVPGAGDLVGTIKLKFTRIYDITYELNGGTQAQNQPTYYASGDNITLLSPTKSRSEFVGWYENADFTGNPVTNLSEKSGDLTLYAKFYTERDVYFQMPPDWYKDQSDSDYAVKIYIYNDSTKESYIAWPGSDMTRVTLNNGAITDVFKYTLSDRYLSQYDSVVFSNGKVPSEGGNTNYAEDIKKRQTIDLSLTSDSYGKIFVPELYKNTAPNKQNEVRFFGRSNQNLYYYAWNNNTQVAKVAWPGEKLTESIGATGYKFIFDKSEFDRMIINRGSGAEQSHDLTIPTIHDLTFSSSAYDSDHYYFYVTRWFYGGSWHSIDNWESSEYSTWSKTDYITFQGTNNEVDAVNSYINS